MRSDYRQRILVVSGFLFSCLLFIAIVVSVTLYFCLSVSQKQAEATLAKEQTKNIVAEADKLEQEIKSFNQKLSRLNKNGTSLPITAVVKSVLSHPIFGIVLNTINYNKSSDGLAILELAGTAKNRSQLLAFVETLRSDPAFSKVDSPVSNLIKESQVDFSLSLQINGQ